MKGIATLIVILWGVVGTPQRPPQFESEIKTVRLTDRLYVLEGGGGNVAVLYGMRVSCWSMTRLHRLPGR